VFWLAVIHIAFVVSGVPMPLMDWLAVRSVKGRILNRRGKMPLVRMPAPR